MNPINEIIVDGNRYVETSDEWKAMCQGLPCFAAVGWDGYPTAMVEDKIGGVPVVIQLWKGNCPPFLGLSNMPGGVGIEVGIYRREPDRKLPGRPPDLPIAAYAMLLPAVEGLVDRWWPIVIPGVKIECAMINPYTKKAVFHARAESSYWCNRWMDKATYEKYASAQPGVPLITQQVPTFACGYELEFSINGKTYPKWTEDKTGVWLKA